MRSPGGLSGFVVLALLAPAVLIAACSGGTPAATSRQSLPALGSPSAGRTAPPLATPRPTSAGGAAGGSAAASTKPYPTKNPSATPRPIVAFHDVTDLESVTPRTAGSTSLKVWSISGLGFRDSRQHKAGLRCRWYEGRGLRCRQQKQLDAVLAQLGRTRADVSIAVGFNETRGAAEVQTLRITGASGQQIRDAVLAVLTDEAAKSGHPLDLQTVSLGGRDVRVITAVNPYPLGKQRWFYASADALYEIRKVDEGTAGQVIGSLP